MTPPDVRYVETPRLLGHPLADGDFEQQCALHGDPAVARTLGGVQSAAWVRERLDAAKAHWAEHGFGWWAFTLREGGAWVGRAGLRRMEIDGVPEVEVGYALLPPYWGRGLATEMARVSVDVAFRRLALPGLVCFALPANRASQAVMRKAGFVYTHRRFLHAGLPHVLYRQANPAPPGTG